MNKKLPLIALVVFVIGVILALLYLKSGKKETGIPFFTGQSEPQEETQIEILPTQAPNNTPTPGSPRLQNPTEDYQKELLENIEEQGITEISLTENGFSPQTVTLKKGVVITWTNNDSVEHEISGDSESWGSYRNLTPKGGKFSQQFDVPGTYPYFSKQNPELKGTIIVTN